MQNSPIPHQCHLTSALVDMNRFRNLSMAFLFLHLPASPSTTRPAPRVPNYPSNAQCHHNSTSIVGDSISMGSFSFCQRFKLCHVKSQSRDSSSANPTRTGSNSESSNFVLFCGSSAQTGRRYGVHQTPKQKRRLPPLMETDTSISVTSFYSL